MPCSLGWTAGVPESWADGNTQTVEVKAAHSLVSLAVPVRGNYMVLGDFG